MDVNSWLILIFLAALILFIAFISGLSQAKEHLRTISGPVVHFFDGDTITVRDPRWGKVRVRLWGMDTPEIGQPGADAAKRELKRLVGKSIVVCERRQEHLSYNRIVAQCFVNGVDIGGELVRSGHAVDVPRFSGGYYAQR
jgi:micrococcal nuclease